MLDISDHNSIVDIGEHLLVSAQIAATKKRAIVIYDEEFAMWQLVQEMKVKTRSKRIMKFLQENLGRVSQKTLLEWVKLDLKWNG